jgi:hypothetical protein
MNHKIKKPWKQPHFIVLVRGIREEMVLVGCKSNAVGTFGPDGLDSYCIYIPPGICNPCMNDTPS